MSTHHTLKQPLFDHVRELRTRVFISCGALLIGGLAGYGIHERLLAALQKPLGQTLFYTSPTGGFSFVFKLCFFFGLLVALPIIVYQLFKFIAPAISRVTKRAFLTLVTWSVVLAAAGVLFAYFVSLPAALHFLANFGGEGIQSLITADSYFNFAMAYLLGFALLFQIPLIIWFINRIKPLKPGKMMRMQKWVILISFIVAAILTPTPDPFNQTLMAAPAIVLYQAGIVLVALSSVRRKRKLKKRTIKIPLMADIERVPVVAAPSPLFNRPKPVLAFDMINAPNLLDLRKPPIGSV